MPTLQPSAEWIAKRPSPTTRGSSTSGCCPEHPVPQAAGADGEAEGLGFREELLHPHDDGVVGHRGSGGLVRGRAVICLPPGAGWFQGHVAYTTVGGCSASLGVLGTELPVDPCMQCCHGGFSRHKLLFINHESGTEAALIVERYGGNMMSLHAEPNVVGAGDGPVPPESELSFQTNVMKADDDARALLDRYFQSIVRAASDPTELRDCIVCLGPMDVPLSLLQELAAPQPDSRTQSMVCSAFAPCRETSPPRNQQQQRQQQQQQQQQEQPPPQPQPRHSRAVGPDENTPMLSPYPLPGDPPERESEPEPEPDTAVKPAAEAAQEQEGAAAAAATAAVAVPPPRPPSPPLPCRNCNREERRGKEEVDGARSRPGQGAGNGAGSGGGGGGNDDAGGATRGALEGARGKGDEGEQDDDVWLEG